MKKTLLAVAVLGAFSTAAFAQTNVTIYGVADLGLVKKTNQSVREEGYRTSRLGFKGTEDLGNGLSAIFNIEGGLSLDTGATNTTAGSTALFNRQSWVGLSSKSIGWVKLGRTTPVFYDAAIRVDPTACQGIIRLCAVDTATNGGYLLGQNNRESNAVTFGTANFGGFVGEAQYVLSEVGKGGKGTSNGYGFAGMYNNGPISAQAAYQKSVGTDFKMWNIGGGYAFGPAKLTVGYSKGNAALAVKNPKSAQLGLDYAVTPSGNLKATYSHSKADKLGKTNQYGLGYEHHLSKRTDVYALASRAKTNSVAINGVAVGLSHNF